jgi:hypothetical protein
MKKKYIAYYDRAELQRDGEATVRYARMPTSRFRGHQRIGVLQVSPNRIGLKTDVGKIVLGRRFLETGYVFAPYMPLFVTAEQMEAEINRLKSLNEGHECVLCNSLGNSTLKMSVPVVVEKVINHMTGELQLTTLPSQPDERVRLYVTPPL